MPGCCAKNCRNRAEQGFRLFRFPADEKRKQIWIKQCAKHPKGDSRLCEVLLNLSKFHFDDSQFENKRQDGRRKLKPNAIPTIFTTEESINEVLQDETESSVGVLTEENVIDQINIQHDNQPVHVDTETQTELGGKHIYF
ncbi:uncharacterized protein LOC112638896 [Camponotus floridanus]|uniref:uncharacterized protein LOC112638896 n=1 Tax=Camponotus floridanus TaxID=104421 RepID=UPI000DC675D3|nr:uncharacterized protein LOC112638896 [Camponotus floridanus]